MRISFAGVEIAREGDGLTDVINLSPITRTARNESVSLIGSAPFQKSRRGSEFSITAKVPYFCESYERATALSVLLGMKMEALTEGNLLITFPDCILAATNAVCETEFPDEITGCFFEVTYKFKFRMPYINRL